MTKRNSEKLGSFIRDARRKADISQEDLAKTLGRSRHWIMQLERGAWFGTGRPFDIDPHELVRVAQAVNSSPVDALTAANIPRDEWPDLSHTRSKDDNVRTIDLTALTVNQVTLIEELVTEFRTGNRYAPGDDTL